VPSNMPNSDRSRRSYRSPALHTYGAMRDLTAGGTAGEAEKGAATQGKKQ
jgi:hypothetical protein